MRPPHFPLFALAASSAARTIPLSIAVADECRDGLLIDSLQHLSHLCLIQSSLWSLSLYMLLSLTRAATLPRFIGTMSTVTVSPAMAILDKLIDHVTNLPSTSSSSSSYTAANSSSSSSTSQSSASATSYLPSHTTDIAWRPIIPIGHTQYTWVGSDDDASASVSATPSATLPAATSSAAAPSASTLTTSAVPRPDSAAAAAASLPPPPAAKPTKEKKAAQPAKGKKEEEKIKTDQPDISRIDIRVGQIVRAWRHPEAEKLYVEEIDVGEDKPRQVVSGLVPYIPLEQFQSARLCVICNLKPSALRGITSYGMVLAASNADRTQVELIVPPVGAVVGERLTLGGLDVLQYEVDGVVDPKKKGNVWDAVKGGLKTDSEGRATWEGKVWQTAAGECRAPTLKDAVIS